MTFHFINLHNNSSISFEMAAKSIRYADGARNSDSLDMFNGRIPVNFKQINNNCLHLFSFTKEFEIRWHISKFIPTTTKNYAASIIDCTILKIRLSIFAVTVSALESACSYIKRFLINLRIRVILWDNTR